MSSPQNSRYFQQMTGQVPADLRIDNVRIADVFSGTFRPGSVSIGCGRILGFERREAAAVVDGGGKFLLPGLIDGHVHIESSMLSPAGFAELVLPLGTTSVIADPHEIVNVGGVKALRWMIRAAEKLPLSIFWMVPSCVPALPGEASGAELDAADTAECLADPHVLGLGEMMNVPGVLMGDPEVHGKLDAAKTLGKIIDGHAPLLGGAGLEVYAGSGVATDHECSTAEELLARVACGMYVQIREGSLAHNLASLVPALTPAIARRCLFCTDDRHAADIMERGHIAGILRDAVALGLDPMTAVTMATLNAAECYGLRDRGAVAPGKRADLVLVEDLKDFRVTDVWSGGARVAGEGSLTAPCERTDLAEVAASVRLAPFTEADFAVLAPSGRARVIGLEPHSLITTELIEEVTVEADGRVMLEKNPGLLKLVVLERHRATGRHGVALLDRRYGLRNGAIATSIAHDSHNIVVAGDSESDMAAAVRAVEAMGGGIAMVSSGDVLASLPLPVGGLMSDAAPSEVAASLRDLIALARDHFGIWEKADAFMTLSFLALPVIPKLKLTADGLFDAEKFTFVPTDAPA